MIGFDPCSVETPCFVADLGALRQNLEILASVQARTSSRVLLALKGFAMWSVFPMLRERLAGVAASSPAEARLGREEFGGEVHVYAPAYSPQDLQEITPYADHIVFNSFGQWQRLGPQVQAARPEIRCGLRVNPEHSEVERPIYDPAAPNSRLGVTAAQFQAANLSGISGLHFHTLCEQDADALERTLQVVEEKFGQYLGGLEWMNFGGGHHITRPGYDIERLIRVILDFAARHRVRVYLEPGEAVALNAGTLVASVLDIIDNGMKIAILDTSASAHMPDVIEMPYRPGIINAAKPGELPYTYRLGGLTCLAGDVIGDYSFEAPLEVGSRIVFTDMLHYTMVKTTTFNGVRHPSIATYDPESQRVEIVRRFGYADYRNRLS